MNNPPEKEPKKKSIVLISFLILVILVILLISLFVYQVLNIKDYSEVYEQRIATGEIVDPITKYGLLFQNMNDVWEVGRDLIVNTLLGDKRIILEKNFPDINLEDLEKEFIEYAAIKLKLYNLQEIPFTSIKPKIQIIVDQRDYFIEVSKGELFVSRGFIDNPDLTLRTSYEEIFKMINNEDYIQESFSSGKSTFELTDNYFVLFSKGYLNLYKELESYF
ncbi:hypothetical protein K0A97_02890 [Patescibacteria group bacterium]|nr:hypothetical protein [Patescibacteria group bacterium]